MTKIMFIAVCLALIAADATAEPRNIRQSLKRHAETAITTEAPAMKTTAQAPRKRSSAWSKLAFGALGGVAGFFAGGYLGAAIDGDCGGCDDPGLKGALIGAPIGAAVGATLGVVLAR
jgi:hypothetical protein